MPLFENMFNPKPKNYFNPINPQFGSITSPSHNSSYSSEPIVQIEGIKDAMKKNTLKYREMLEKYKDIQDINKQLTGKYVKNLEIILDVSKILNLYMETFDAIREEITKSSDMMSPISVTDLSYIEHITSNSVKSLSNTLLTEINKLESLLDKSKGFSKETEHLRNLRTSLLTPFVAPQLRMGGTRKAASRRTKK